RSRRRARSAAQRPAAVRAPARARGDRRARAAARRARDHDRHAGPRMAGRAHGCGRPRAGGARVVERPARLGASMIRVAAALVALLVAGLLVALAIDAGRWQPVRAQRPPTLVGHVAERVLGTTDDVALRRAIAAFVTAERTPYGFDNGANQARVRVLAQ